LCRFSLSDYGSSAVPTAAIVCEANTRRRHRHLGGHNANRADSASTASGLGFHLINTDRTTLDLLGGLNYNPWELHDLEPKFCGSYGGGGTHANKLRVSTVLNEKLYFFPDLNQTGEYRATFNLGTVTKLSKWLGWQNAFGDIYVTNPPIGKKQNDILLTTGLNVSFSH
jgi:putative salt-induced outer membrane protein